MDIRGKLIICGSVVSLVVFAQSIVKLNSYNAKIELDDTSVKYFYDTNEIKGKLRYNEIEEFLRIVKFEKEGVTFTKLVTKDIDTIYHRYSHREKKYIYADLETGTVLKSYSYPEKDNESQDIELEKNITHKVGENLNILEEKDFSTYLLQQNNLKNIYTVKELVDFYKEKVVPTIEKNKTLTK